MFTLPRTFDDTASLTASVARLGAGYVVRRPRLGPRPEQRLILYDFEGCPFCRKAREALSELDLEVEVRPCPKGGTRFRPEVEARGGKAMFPYLVDANTGEELYESEDITRYLFERYGPGHPPNRARVAPINTASSLVASLFRVGKGSKARPSRAPERPLHLYSFEASPWCRVVRETLCELEIPYVLTNVAKRSPSRRAFIERSGKMQVPYLVDDNEGVEMFESKDIIGYLERTYGA